MKAPFDQSALEEQGTRAAQAVAPGDPRLSWPGAQAGDNRRNGSLSMRQATWLRGDRFVGRTIREPRPKGAFPAELLASLLERRRRQRRVKMIARKSNFAEPPLLNAHVPRRESSRCSGHLSGLRGSRLHNDFFNLNKAAI